MLKSKLGLKNKDKDANTTTNVNNKDSNIGHGSKSRVKKLLNGKSSGHTILSINNIKPVKPKGSLYELNNNSLEGEEKLKNEDDIDDTTLTSSSPQGLESVDKNNYDAKTSEKQDLNNLNDTQSSPNLHWTVNSSSKDVVNPTMTNLNIHTENNPKIGSTSKVKSSSSPFLSPKSPKEVFTRFTHLKSPDNPSSLSAKSSGNYLSVPNLEHQNSSNSLHSKDSQGSLVTASADTGLNKLTKKLSKKEKKEGNTNANKKPSSLFSSLGRYFKNKASDKIKDKEGKKSKEKQETEDDQEIEEIKEEETKMDLEKNMEGLKIKSKDLEKVEIIKVSEEPLKTPIPKETDNDKRPLSKISTLKSGDDYTSTSMQSITLVDSQANKSLNSSPTTQPIPIHSTLQVIDQNMRITSSPSSSLPPISPSSSNDHTDGIDNIIDRESTYRQSSSKYDDASFLENEDTIIKKSSIISTNNNRLSVRDIDFCHELRLAGGMERSRNSLNFESTITELKRQSGLTITDETKSTLKTLTENEKLKPIEMPKSPLATTAHTIQNSEEVLYDNKDTSVEKDTKENIPKKSSFLKVKDNDQHSFDASLDETSVHEFNHNVLASSPQLSIPSPYKHSNYSTSAALKKNIQDKNGNLFVPKAPSAIGLVNTPSNSTQATSISELPKVSASLDAISMALMEEPLEEKRCPYCHCTIYANQNFGFDPSLDNISYDEDKISFNSSSRVSSATKLTQSPKLSPHSVALDNHANKPYHFGQFLSSGGPGSIASSISSKDYKSINSSFTFSTVTSTASEEDCDCFCHEARYQHPEFPVYHSKHGSSFEQTSQASVSGMSFNSYQSSQYSNYSYYTDSINKIYDKRSYCSTASSMSISKSLFNSDIKNNKNIRRKDFSKSSREIGRGATCVVKLVHKINDPNMYYALKEYKLSRVKQNIDERTFLKHLRNEYQIGSLLHHPNIIETYAFLMTKTHNHKRRKYFVVLEYCNGGDLFTTIQNGNLGRQEINCNFKQLMDGVNYLHSLGVAHCDIKPENILIKNVSQLKIIDFGTSEIFKYPYTPDTIKKSRGIKGSKPYIAPEQFQRSEYDPRASDIWSCAIVYLASLFDELPWRVATLEDFDYLRWKKERRNDLIRHLPDGPRQLITQMLHPDPEKRITMEQIYENEWFSSIKTCISGEVQCHEKKHLHTSSQDS
ncbi:Pkinase-domain-containing protein [Piromyces finnis]|uniref:non-specific serine/threonine protein kinase n=1 Tax=Piromyces finnis TaxID=1754191 RepID=A0A1Y1VBJ0_9FUNG|nr:Pkinase-domain-containing protein [Piromyces finnis]|eukprot:ORX51825.1 Pkinase-domain-containing protein [Piromyces finnis]